MEQPLVVLMASLLLGPSAWQPVAAELRARGREVIVVPAGATNAATAEQAFEVYAREIPRDREVLLVPHSNAGNFVAGLTVSHRVVGVIFVDAVIPVVAGDQPLAPAGFLAHIETLADTDGVLPVWTSWFGDADVSELFPDATTQASIVAAQPRVPLQLLRSVLPVEPGWDSVPAAYVAFGATYADETERAIRNHWPVVVLDGLHLHMLVDPSVVADEIMRNGAILHK